LERFLYRLSVSRHRDSFVLKGELLLKVWTRTALAWRVLVNSLLLPASTEGFVELYKAPVLVAAG
jgi:hypothetical protein